MSDWSFKERLAQELEYINFPEENWVAPSPNKFDVVVVGAGMAGLAISFALRRLGISRIGIYDQSIEGYEGPWATYARMPTLRSGKELVGPALDFPLLTFRAWFEASFGLDKWSQLGKIPTDQWMEYLRWFRRVLNVPIENGKILTYIQPQKHGLSLTIGTEEVTTSKVILATGRSGFGGSNIPSFVSQLPRKCYAHTNDSIDFPSLRDKRVGVIGGGASGFDAAAAALEMGAFQVDMILRREKLPAFNKAASITYPGFSQGYYQLDDEKRWKLLEICYRYGVPPPHESVERIINHPHFAIVRNAPIEDAKWIDERVHLKTTKGNLIYDYIILATGFHIDGSKQEELKYFIDKIQLWGNRDTIKHLSGPGWFYKSPYLGPHFQFLERNKGEAPYLKDIYCFNYAATLSHGLLSGDIPGIGVGASRIAQGIASDLFGEGWHDYYQRLDDYQKPELSPDLR